MAINDKYWNKYFGNPEPYSPQRELPIRKEALKKGRPKMAQHVHKYRRINIARDGRPPYWVMQCSLPGCNSYTPMKTFESCPYLVGKTSICNVCGDRFVMTRKSLQLAKPRCEHCVQSRKKEEMDKAARFFREMEGSIPDDTV